MAPSSRNNGKAKNAELLLQTEKLFIDALINSLPGILYLYNEQGQFLRWNRSFEIVSGYSPKELARIHPLDFFAESEKQIIAEKIQEAFTTGDAWVEAGFVTKDRRVLPFFLTGRRILFEGKQCVIGMGIDISKRKKIEERVEEQAAFLDEARDAIVARGLDGTLLYWNQGAERMFGWKREEVLGRNVGEFFYADSAVYDQLNQGVIDKGEWSGELRVLGKDRQEIIVESRWTLIRDKAGKPKSVLGINTDITEKKKIEAQFLRAQRMESIGTLAGGIAHDLNNILAPILISIELLQKSARDRQSAKLLKTIHTSAQRGADIVRQVLSFARGVEGERIEIQPKHLLNDLAHIINDTFPKNILQDFTVPREIWTISGDATQVHQVLLNLCVNARDAMPNGGRLDVKVENCELDANYAAMNLQAKPGRYVKISVTDTGMGIPRENLDKIFEPFFTTKDVNKGTGLGLSTVVAIVKSHGGMINVYSERGKGTAFHVYFPAMEPSDAARGLEEKVDLPRGKGETVLLVDDEAAIVTITGKTLKSFGYRVMTASDGADGLALYARHHRKIAVVITDMMMPVLGGAALIQALTRINPEVKVISTSGLSTNESAAQQSGAKAKHFLIKPYTAADLLKTLRLVIEEKEPSSQPPKRKRKVPRHVQKNSHHRLKRS